MSELTLIATVVAKSESVVAVRKALGRLVEPTRQESGCLEYLLHQDKADSATFVFYECWESEEHLKRHSESTHFIKCQEAIKEMVEPTTLQELTHLA